MSILLRKQNSTDMFKSTHIKMIRVKHHVPMNSPLDTAQNSLTKHKLVSMFIKVKALGNSV